MKGVMDNRYGFIYTYQATNNLKDRKPDFEKKKDDNLELDENETFSSLLKVKMNSLS